MKPKQDNELDSLLNVLALGMKKLEEKIRREESKVGYKTTSILKELSYLQKFKERFQVFKEYVEHNKKNGDVNIDQILRSIVVRNFFLETGEDDSKTTWLNVLQEVNSYSNKIDDKGLSNEIIQSILATDIEKIKPLDLDK